MSIYLFQLGLLLVVATVFLDAQHQWDPRIVNGVRISIKDAPWQVSLIYGNNHLCGGAIYSENIIITAAHCLFGNYPQELKIRAGSTNKSSGGQVRQVVGYKFHERFNIYIKTNDIAVLRLDKPLTLGRLVRTIPLAHEDPTEGANVTVSGWGVFKFDNENPVYPEELQGVNLTVANRNVCDSAYPGALAKDILCVVGENKGVCHGDSGGPLINDNEQLVGIVSCRGDCYKSPGVFASVAYYRTWLLKAIKCLSPK